MIARRSLFLAAPALLRGAGMSHKDRVDTVLRGQTPDRLPVSLWHHFQLESQGPAAHARRTLDFHRQNGTDLVKVMSDFPYPKPSGDWWNLRVEENPFPAQLVALAMIGDAVRTSAHFVETIFNPWNVAEKLASKEAVLRTMREQPQRLLDALEAIAGSEANHARLAVRTGASGVFLAIANAQAGILSQDEYRKFSEPFDRMVLEAAADAPLNILHLHGEKVYTGLFQTGWGNAAINYSAAETGVSLARMREKFSGVLLGGIDHRSYVTRSTRHLKADAAAARREAGPKLILTPGCSVPDNSPAEALQRLSAAV